MTQLRRSTDGQIDDSPDSRPRSVTGRAVPDQWSGVTGRDGVVT